VRPERASRCQRTARPCGRVRHSGDEVDIGPRNRFMRSRAFDDYTEVDWLYADPHPGDETSHPNGPTASSAA
jgi:hypothetical protein